MNVRQDILEVILPKPCDGYGVHVNWCGNIYHDYNSERLINRVIQSELASLDTAISNLDTFNEDHAGELQELLFYRDYLSNGLHY